MGAARDQERHVLGLDLIRFAAAALVMVFHYGHEIAPIPLSWAGWVGVEVFFVLSGYVIATSSEGSAPGAFARNRVVRLMPAVWICSSIAAALCLVQGSYVDLASRYLNSLVLWPVGPWVDSALWTLPVEVVFYGLVFACLLARLPLAGPLRALAVVSFLYWVLRLAAVFHLTTGTAGLSEFVARLSMLAFGCYFAVGGLMREIVSRGWTIERGLFLSISLMAGAAQIAFAASSWAPEGALAGVAHAGKLVPLLTWLVLVALMAVSVRGNAMAWRFFAPAAPAIRLLGLATYPLYLLHHSVGNALDFAPTLKTPLVASGLAIGLSVAVAATIEPQAQRLLRRTLRAAPARRVLQAQSPPQT